jgi:hypothetical protein
MSHSALRRATQGSHAHDYANMLWRIASITSALHRGALTVWKTLMHSVQICDALQDRTVLHGSRRFHIGI